MAHGARPAVGSGDARAERRPGGARRRVPAPYLPRVVIRELARDPPAAVRSLPGTLVFADVSGFTQLSERLARHRRARAPSRSADAIGGSFAALLEVAYANGGGLLKFGGDALLLFFDGDGHAERACRAAIAHARARCAPPARSRRPAPASRCACRSASTAARCTCSSPAARTASRVVAGPAVIGGAAHGEGGARAGEIVVSPAVAAAAAEPRPRRPGRAGPAAAGRAAASATSRAEEPAPEVDARVGWPLGLPIAVRAHVLGGGRPPEHRIVTVAFVRFGGTDALDRARTARPPRRRRSDELVARRPGRGRRRTRSPSSARDVDVDGGKLLLCAGAPRAVGDDEERMLLDAARASSSAGAGCRCRSASTAGRVHGRHRPAATAAPTR